MATMTNKVQCFFCDFSSRRDNVLRHCRALHIFEETSGVETIGTKIRIVKQGDKHYAYCFGCKNLIKSRYFSLSTVRQLSRTHLCTEATISCSESVSRSSVSSISISSTPSSLPTNIEPSSLEDNFKIQLEELLRIERPDLFSGKNRRTLMEKVKQICKDERMISDLVDSAHKERDEFETKYNEETALLEEKVFILQQECDDLRQRLKETEKSEQQHIQMWRQTDKELYELRKQIMKI